MLRRCVGSMRGSCSLICRSRTGTFAYKHTNSTMTSTIGSKTNINYHALGARLHASYEDTQRRSPLLLILDLHGVLVQRIGRKEPELRDLTKKRRNPYMRHNQHDIWLRPHLAKFLTIASARHSLAIWSAATPKTVNPMLDEMSSITRLEPPLRQRFRHVLKRNTCRPDKEKRKGWTPYSVVKYLPDVWKLSSPSWDEYFEPFDDLQKPPLKFNDRNTIIVDDTISKIRYHPSSAIVLPEYNVYNHFFTYEIDDTLLWLLLYLEYLIDASGLHFDHHQDQNENMNDATPGISAQRPFLLSFDAFWETAFNHAFAASTPDQRKEYASLAYVFFPSELIKDMHEGNPTAHEKSHNLNEGNSNTQNKKARKLRSDSSNAKNKKASNLHEDNSNTQNEEGQNLHEDNSKAGKKGKKKASKSRRGKYSKKNKPKPVKSKQPEPQTSLDDEKE